MGKSKTTSTTAPSYAWTYAPQASALQGLYSQSQNALSGATQQANYMQNLGNQAVGSQLDPRVSQASFQALQSTMQPGVNPALGAYQRDVQQNFQNTIMPGINAQSAAAGQLGSSRGQIAGQQAGLQANQQVADMAAKLYGEDMNRRIQAAQVGLGSQTAALGQLPQLAGISQQPYINQAQILGTSPLALSVGGGGGSSGKSKSL
jgi:hypothetical protein